MSSPLNRDSIAEFIGTFMLVFVGAGAVIATRDVVAVALAHGLMLAVIVYTFGHFSGAHVNPAVTLGLLVGGKVNTMRAIRYWVAQFAGGIAAAILLWIVIPEATRGNLGATVPVGEVTNLQALIIEFVLTFFLVSTVYQAAVYGKAEHMAGLAIGLTLAVGILMGGALTGASLNPARTVGPAVVAGEFDAILFYLVGIFGGGAVAGFLHSTFFKPTQA
jgi:MIP family channel proteins